MSVIQNIQANLPDVAVNVIRLTVWLFLLCAIFVPLERFCAVRADKSAMRDWQQNLAYYFLNGLLPLAVLSALMSVFAVGAQHFVPAIIPASLAGLPVAAKLALAFIIGEIGYYWGHRLSHEIPWLWRFHAIHHSPEHLYFLINTRAHPVDLIVTRLFSMVPLYLLGLAGPSAGGSVTPVLVILVGTLWGFFIHADLHWRFGPLEWMISTPGFHHWHHTRSDHIDRNYASMLPILDKLFGTFYLPQEWPSAYGTDTAQSPLFVRQLTDPLQAERSHTSTTPKG